MTPRCDICGGAHPESTHPAQELPQLARCGACKEFYPYDGVTTTGRRITYAQDGLTVCNICISAAKHGRIP